MSRSQASKALKLCCRVSWTCVKRLCQIFVQKSEELVGDFSEDAIVEFVNDACTRSAFLLDVLHQCDSHKVKRTVAESLEDWCVAGKVFERLPGPVPLVKQWVKVILRAFKCCNCNIYIYIYIYLLLFPH
jgi:separase